MLLIFKVVLKLVGLWIIICLAAQKLLVYVLIQKRLIMVALFVVMELLKFVHLLEVVVEKEILGHLIDSGINNLQRFTKIKFEDKPYIIRKYKRNELVKANDYQNAQTNEIIKFCLSINNRI